jgi:hypothetical protein
MSYIKTGDVENKIRAPSLNNRTVRKGWELGELKLDWLEFLGWNF